MYPISPTTDGYFIGKGNVVFKPDGSSIFRHVGNVPEFEFTPSTDTLDHFSAMAGVKSKDKTIVISKGGELRMVLDELSPENLAMLLLGDVSYADPLHPVVNIFSLNSVAGEVRFYASNDIGPRWDGVFKGVDFLPSGSFQPISDEYGKLEVTGQVRTVAGAFGTWTFRDTLATQVAAAPANIANPVITGGLVNGSVHTVRSDGVWLNNPVSFAYSWFRDGVVIAAQTASTYTTVVGDVGKVITAKVVATNATGSSAAVVSNGIGPIT
jgi:hypothetical protein